MKIRMKYLCVFFLVMISQIVCSQEENESYENTRTAIELMDSGNVDEAIDLLNKTLKKYPNELFPSYELGYAYYLKQDYKKTIKVLDKMKKHPKVYDQIYQILGNAYDMKGDSKKAIKIYEEGLAKFPNSGCLYLERGNMEWLNKDYVRALNWYEKGIENAPKFPSNYYRATIIYAASEEAYYAFVYGEIFLNLELNTPRSNEISRLLYDLYKNRIEIVSADSVKLNFNTIYNINVLPDMSNLEKELRKAMDFMNYKKALERSILGESIIDLNSLNRIRTRFVEFYSKKEMEEIENGLDEEMDDTVGVDIAPPLIKFQKKILDAGHMEAYNYWLLSSGDDAEFESWYYNNFDKWNAFSEWFPKHLLNLE